LVYRGKIVQNIEMTILPLVKTTNQLLSISLEMERIRFLILDDLRFSFSGWQPTHYGHGGPWTSIKCFI
jgi:hypothetical protein